MFGVRQFTSTMYTNKWRSRCTQRHVCMCVYILHYVCVRLSIHYMMCVCVCVCLYMSCIAYVSTNGYVVCTCSRVILECRGGICARRVGTSTWEAPLSSRYERPHACAHNIVHVHVCIFKRYAYSKIQIGCVLKFQIVCVLKIHFGMRTGKCDVSVYACKMCCKRARDSNAVEDYGS